MDIEAYIQSGIIESYVLGIATNEEVLELEQLRKQYPQVQQAIDDFSESLQRRAFENAVPPPASVKADLFKSLASEFQEVSTQSVVVPVNTTSSTRLTPPPSIQVWRFAAAAAVIFLITSAAFNIYLFNRYSATSEQYQALLNERNTLQASNDIYQTKLRAWQTLAQLMADTSMITVRMPGVPGKKDILATVLWNADSKEVYLMANSLPPVPADRQYQLWALVDGKPVDAGMLDPDCTGACKMKNIPRAQAFAITLEKKGGSPSPDMQQLFVMGKV